MATVPATKENHKSSRGNRLKVPKAAEIIANRMLARIVSGEWREGTLLSTESRLSVEYGVSRQTFREAMRLLESDGLVSILRGARGGAVVHQPGIGIATRQLSLLFQMRKLRLIDIQQVRMQVEPGAVRLLAQKGGKDTARELRKFLEDSGWRSADDFEYMEAMNAFHNKIIELSGNVILAILIAMLNDVFKGFWSAALTKGSRSGIVGSSNRAKVHRAVERLIEFIERGDAKGAEFHWIRYGEDVDRTLRKGRLANKPIDLLDSPIS